MNSFDCSSNQLTSLEHCPEFILNRLWYTKSIFSATNNNISSLVGFGRKFCKQINGKLDLSRNPLISNALGLLLIKDLTSVVFDNEKLQNIFNYYLKGESDVMDCMEELTQARLTAFARF